MNKIEAGMGATLLSIKKERSKYLKTSTAFISVLSNVEKLSDAKFIRRMYTALVYIYSEKAFIVNSRKPLGSKTHFAKRNEAVTCNNFASPLLALA